MAAGSGPTRARRPLVPLSSGTEPLAPTAARILEAAMHVLSDQGFAALTLEAIAAEAGVN